MAGDIERAEERLRVLTSAMRMFAEATTDLDELLRVVARSVAEILGDECALLTLSEDGTHLRPTAAHAVDPQSLARSMSILETDPIFLETHPLVQSVVETHGPLLIPHIDRAALERQTTRSYAAHLAEQGLHSLLVVALHVHGKTLGVLALTRYRETSPAFDEHDKTLAMNLADHAALTISNARLYAAERTARLAAEEAMTSQREAEFRFAQLSERKKTEFELLRAKEAADVANRELESFSYSVAHDLRAPLRGMNGFAQILLEDHGEAMSEDARKLLGRIMGSAERMAALIDGLLTLSRLTRAPIRRQTVDLSLLVRTSLAQALAEAEAAQAERPKTEVVIEAGLSVEADATLLQAMIDNLGANAVKFTSRTAAPRIEVGRREADGEDVYFIRDNGAGFDMQYANKLFGPFQRLHRVEDYAGTGIGLATVQRIVARHGGRIWAEAYVEGGATFSFTLPS